MNFNLNHLLIWAYMSRNFSSTVIRSCPKAIFNKLWDQFPATDVRTTISAKQVNTNTLWFQLQKFPLLLKKPYKYWR
jgi:hypothetical protein